jgi:hypothetical protein
VPRTAIRTFELSELVGKSRSIAGTRVDRQTRRCLRDANHAKRNLPLPVKDVVSSFMLASMLTVIGAPRSNCRH